MGEPTLRKANHFRDIPVVTLRFVYSDNHFTLMREKEREL